MPLVQAVRTTTTKKDLSKAIIQCWRSLYGYTPSKESVGVIISQNMIETGGVNFWNWNKKRNTGKPRNGHCPCNSCG